jgi:hypothetical protein
MTVYWAKPTLDDIAAQRAMIERGEEKRKAAQQAEERERLRDTFAAAALSGILTKDDAAQLEKMAPWWPEWACSAAYRWADAMLFERDRVTEPMTENKRAEVLLTDEEREAIDNVAAFLFGLADTSVQAGSGEKLRRHAATLRSLLERLHT